jgi:catechol 2,3-dioxygenase-like lactoylglutathione lyase family enzyme
VGSAEALVGGRLFQVAFVVRDLDAALARFGGLLPTGGWRCYTFGSAMHAETEYLGAPAEFSVRLALSDSSPQLELIQPLEGASIHRDLLDEVGEGLHHVGVVVDSVPDTVGRMSAAGYEVVQSGSGFGVDGDGVYAYFDTREALGVYVEAVEPPRRLA